MTAGVYLIKNLRTGDTYVGASINLEKRRSQHFRLLRTGKHPLPLLRAAFAPFNPDEFSFEILELFDAGQYPFEREREWIRKLRPTCNRPMNPAVPAKRPRILNCDAIRSRRVELGLSQTTAARLAGIRGGAGQWSDIESGRKANINLKTLSKIGSALQQDVRLFLRRRCEVKKRTATR